MSGDRHLGQAYARLVPAPHPGKSAHRVIPVVFPAWQRPLRVAALGELVGYMCHWLPDLDSHGEPMRTGRQVPCLGESCDCKERAWSLRWAGFVPAIREEDRSPVVALVSSMAAAMLLKQLNGLPFRGQRIELKRTHPHPNSRVLGSVLNPPIRQEVVDQWPDAFSVEGVLMRLWGIDR